MSSEWNDYLTEMDEVKNFLSSISSKDEIISMPKSVVKFLVKLLNELKTKFQEINARLTAPEGA